MLGDPAGLELPADHEAGDVLQEQQRDFALVAQLDEVRALEGGLAEQHAVVRHDAHRVAVQPGGAGDQRRAVLAFEFGEPAPVDDTGDDLADVVGDAAVGGDDRVQLCRVGGRLLRRGDIPGPGGARREAGHDRPYPAQRVGVVVGEMVGDPGGFAVQQPAAEVLRRDDLPGRGPHQWRTTQEDRPLVPDDDGLVAHRRDVGATGRARAEDRGDLRDTGRRHRRLVVEDPPEVLAVGEHLVLQREERPPGVDEVDTRQPVVQCHLLRPQVLFDGDGVVGAALDRRVVRHHHALTPGHPSDTGDDPRARCLVAVHAVGGQRREFQERAAAVEQGVDPVPGQQFAPAHMAVAGLLRPAPRGRCQRGP